MATATLSVTPAALRCQVLTRAEELAEWSPAWLDLLHRSAGDEVMLSPTWLRAWWDFYGENQGRELRVCLFFDGQKLIGLAPLLARWVRHYGCLPFQRLEFLGSDHDQADAICSDYLNVIAERGAEACVSQALTRELLAGRCGSWQELWLPVMDGSGAMPDHLLAAFWQAGLWAEKTAYPDAPFLALPTTWDAYLTGLPQRKRYFINRTLREFAAWTGSDFRIHRVTNPPELENAEAILASLHAERWSQEGSAGVFDSPRFRAFHRRVMGELLVQGALDLCWLEAKGEPVAALYCMNWNAKVAFYQCGRRMNLPPNQRPGIVLLAFALRSAIEAGQREFDFLAGLSRYKMDFCPQLRPLVQIRAVRPSFRERARLAIQNAIAVGRRLRRTWREACATKPMIAGQPDTTASCVNDC